MANSPEHGTFKIVTVGPPKDIPNKKDPNKPWRSWSLQFEGDNQWYDTFWLQQNDPKEGDELTGTKTYDEKWNTYKFEVDRAGGKNNWNPAAAQATVMLASVELVNGFLALPGMFELWAKAESDKDAANKLKAYFNKYVKTVVETSKQVKGAVVDMGALGNDKKTEGKTEPAGNGDPGPTTPPPDLDDLGDEPINLDDLPV